MRILKSTRTDFERQILESVAIQKNRNNNIMNNKTEYNRCALPRLTAKLGEKDLEKWRAEDRDGERGNNRRENKNKKERKGKEKRRNTQKNGARTTQEKEDKTRRWTSNNRGGVQ